MPPAGAPQRAYRYLDTITVAFGGTILFPLSYIFGDVLTEVYGYRRSRRVIWSGFGATALMAAIFMLVGALPAAPDWPHQEAYQTILGLTPRIVIASLVAYFLGEFSNSYVLAKMKVWTGGRYLWTRTIGSTLVGQAVDTTAFILIATALDVFPLEIMLSLIITNYILKVGFEAALTPLTYRVVNALKAAEDEDYFDRETDFNPFKLSV